MRRRTAGELLSAAEALAGEKKRIATEMAAAKKARRERDRAAAREQYLDGLVKKENETWPSALARI